MTRHRPVRRGGIAVWVLLTLPVLLLILIVGLSQREVTLMVEESRRTADACANDSVLSLVGDDLLIARLSDNGRRLRPTFDRAHDAAERAACSNPIFGHAIVPDRNRDNDPCGQFVFGFVRHHGYGVPFHPVGDHNRQMANAVYVRLERRGRHGIRMPGGLRESLVVEATAMLDGDVAGFRTVNDCSTIPFCPLALDRREWDSGLDEDCDSHGLPEIEFVLLASEHRSRKPTAVPLTIGTRNATELAAQVEDGIADEQYDRFVNGHGPLEMDERHHRLVVPGERYTGSAHAKLLKALNDLRRSGEARALPTTTQFDPRNDKAVWVTGFVAARVVRVTEETLSDRHDRAELEGEGEELEANGRSQTVKCIRVVLRPTMISTPTAVTRPSAPPNPYLCRVRLVHCD